MKRLRLLLLSLGFFFVLFAVIFVVAELLLRYSILKVAAESRDHVRETDYMPVKFKGHYEGIFWGVPFRTNRNGFRDEPDFPQVPEPGEYRILSLGDSIGFGLGIPASSHYTKVAERRLNELPSPYRFRVINASGQGYSPSNYYVYLRNDEGLELEPEMIIADIEACTVVTNEALLHWVPDPENPSVPIAIRGGRYVVGWDGNMLATYAVGGYFFEKTYVYTDLLRRYLNLMFRVSPNEPFASRSESGVSYYDLGFDRWVLDEQRLESGWQKAFASLKGIQALAEARGAKFLLLIVPSRYMFEAEAMNWRRFATGLMERAVRRAQELQIPHIDLTAAVRDGGGAPLYYDFAHMTEAGNKVLGEALYSRLVSEIGLEAPKATARLSDSN